MPNSAVAKQAEYKHLFIELKSLSICTLTLSYQGCWVRQSATPPTRTYAEGNGSAVFLRPGTLKFALAWPKITICVHVGHGTRGSRAPQRWSKHPSLCQIPQNFQGLLLSPKDTDSTFSHTAYLRSYGVPMDMQVRDTVCTRQPRLLHVYTDGGNSDHDGGFQPAASLLVPSAQIEH